MLFILILAVLFAFIYSVGDIIAPFATGLVIAYFCAPLVDRLERLKLGRTISTIIVMCGIVVLLLLFSMTVIPLLYKQISWLAHAAVVHKASLNNFIVSLTTSKYIPEDLISGLQTSFSEISSSILGFSGSLISRALQSSIAAVSMITMLFVTPIVLYYFLIGWPKIVSTIDSLIPRDMLTGYLSIKKDLDYALSNYVRGQSLVCLIMGIYYAIGLTLIGAESGLALGFISGVLTFIPYVGALFSVSLSCIVIAVQYASMTKVLMAMAVFALGQFIEGNFIVPNLVGSKLHLHPVWIMFGLLAGGALFGFIGMLLALPLTAVIAVIIRYLLKEYKNSPIYRS